MTEQQSNFAEKECKNMCGFFGSESHDGYCSVCYRKHVKDVELDEDEELEIDHYHHPPDHLQQHHEDDEVEICRSVSQTVSRKSLSSPIDGLLSSTPSRNAILSSQYSSFSDNCPPTAQMILASRMSPTNSVVHGCISSEIQCQMRTPSKSPPLRSAHEVPPMAALKSGTGMPGTQESFKIFDNLQLEKQAERFFDYHQMQQQACSSGCDDYTAFSYLSSTVCNNNCRRSSSPPVPSSDDLCKKVLASHHAPTTLSSPIEDKQHDQSSSTMDCDESGSSGSAKPSKCNRCGVCNRKLGLTGFMCRCGGKFCGIHRYSDKHECSFDYKEYGQREIRKNNPVVSGEKITKI